MPFVNGAGGLRWPVSHGVQRQQRGAHLRPRGADPDVSFNVKWDITENLHSQFDVQYIKAETSNYDILVAANSLAQVDYSTNGDGTPVIALSPGPNVNYADGFLANPHNYWMQFIQDHWEDNDADEMAARADLEYDLGSGGWLSSLKAGVRFADREQKVRYSSYNWAPIAPAWNCNGPGFNVDNTQAAAYPAACGNANAFNGYPAGIWESTSLDGHYNGNVLAGGPLVFLNRATLNDYDLHTEGLADRNVNAPQGWNPLCDRTANVPGEGCFTPARDPRREREEQGRVPDAALRWTRGEPRQRQCGGQHRCALREDRRDPAMDSVSFPTSQWYTQALASGQGACNPADNGTNQATDIQCWLTPELLAYSNGTGAPNTLDKSY